MQTNGRSIEPRDEFRGLSYEAASRKAFELITRAYKTGHWWKDLPEVLIELRAVMCRVPIVERPTAITEPPRPTTSALADILNEYIRARTLHGPTHSAHEAYAVFLEEVDELWDEIKRNPRDNKAMREEAVQVGAMALLVEQCA